MELFCEANSHRNNLLKKFRSVGSSIFSEGLTRCRCKWLPNALFCHHIAQKIKPSHADPPCANGSCSSKWVFDKKKLVILWVYDLSRRPCALQGPNLALLCTRFDLAKSMERLKQICNSKYEEKERQERERDVKNSIRISRY